MSTQLVPVSEVEAYLIESQHKIQGLLPKHLTAERMIRLAVHACERNVALLKCSKASLLSALIEASEVGLEPIGVLGEAAIIPYKGVATFQPMYKGLIKLARQAGNVIDIHAECVGQNDEFDFYHATPVDVLHHRPSLTGRGEWIGVWARAILPEGVTKMLYYDREKIERIRSMSKEPNGLMWGNHWDEAAKKTVIKGLCKTLPQSPELSRAIDIDHRVDVGDLNRSAVETPIMQMPKRLSEATETAPPTAPPPAEVVPPECPEHGSMRLVPAGVSKAGKSYAAFYGCERGCKTKGVNASTWAEEQAKKKEIAAFENGLEEKADAGKKAAVEREQKRKGLLSDDQLAKLDKACLEHNVSSSFFSQILGTKGREKKEEIKEGDFEAIMKEVEEHGKVKA